MIKERGMADPTNSTSLHLVCRGIHCQQGDNQRTRLPIAHNNQHFTSLKRAVTNLNTLYHTGATNAMGSVVYYSLLWLFPCKWTNTKSLLINHYTLLSANIYYLTPVKIRLLSPWFNYPFIFYWLICMPLYGNDCICRQCTLIPCLTTLFLYRTGRFSPLTQKTSIEL